MSRFFYGMGPDDDDNYDDYLNWHRDDKMGVIYF